MTTAETVEQRGGEASGGPRRQTAGLAAPALLGLVGMVAILLVTARNGPGVTPDSVSYLAAARSLLDGEGFRGPDGESFVAFPPLFPVAIAGISLGVVGLVEAARVVVAVSFGLTVFLTGWAAGRIGGSWVWGALGSFGVLVSEPVLVTALHVWSEPLFMALTMLGLALMGTALTPDPSPVVTGEGSLDSPRASAPHSVRTGGGRSWRSRFVQAPLSRRDGRGVGGEGGLALVATALSSLTRYIGVVLPLTQAGVALVAGKHGVRVRRAALALLGLVPLLLWLVRNVVVSGAPLGERTQADTTLSENARAATEVLLGWLVPLDVAMRWRALIVLLVALPVLIPLLIGARRHETDARQLPWAVLPFALFAALYAGYLVIGATLVAVDPIDDRLVAPLLPALVVTAIGLLRVSGTTWAAPPGSAGVSPASAVAGWWNGRARRPRSQGGLAPTEDEAAARGTGVRRWAGVGRAVGVAAALVWLAASAVQAGRLVRRVETDGIGGYAAARWIESETLASVRGELPDATIVSNDPFAIHYNTGREARLSPRRYPYRAPQGRVDDLPDLVRELDAGETVYLVWFGSVPRDFLLSLSDLEAILDLEPVVRASDGAVYRVRGLK